MVKIELSENDVQVCLSLFTVASKHPETNMQVTAAAVNMFGLFAKAAEDAKAPPVEPTNVTPETTEPKD